jgi:hypothetical protein
MKSGHVVEIVRGVSVPCLLNYLKEHWHLHPKGFKFKLGLGSWSLCAFGISRNFGSGNSGFQKCYPKLYPNFLIADISGTQKFRFRYWVTCFTRL